MVARLAIKPTSSILTPQRSLNRFGEAVEVVTKADTTPALPFAGFPWPRP